MPHPQSPQRQAVFKHSAGVWLTATSPFYATTLGPSVCRAITHWSVSPGYGPKWRSSAPSFLALKMVPIPVPKTSLGWWLLTKGDFPKFDKLFRWVKCHLSRNIVLVALLLAWIPTIVVPILPTCLSTFLALTLCACQHHWQIPTNGDNFLIEIRDFPCRITPKGHLSDDYSEVDSNKTNRNGWKWYPIPPRSQSEQQLHTVHPWRWWTPSAEKKKHRGWRTSLGALTHLAALLLQPARALLLPLPPKLGARLQRSCQWLGPKNHPMAVVRCLILGNTQRLPDDPDWNWALNPTDKGHGCARTCRTQSRDRMESARFNRRRFHQRHSPLTLPGRIFQVFPTLTMGGSPGSRCGFI